MRVPLPGGLDDLGPADLGLELPDPALDEPLALLRGVVLGVLGEVAVRPRLGDGPDDARALDALELLQLLLEPGVTFPGHRRPLYHSSVPRVVRVVPGGRASATARAVILLPPGTMDATLLWHPRRPPSRFRAARASGLRCGLVLLGLAVVAGAHAQPRAPGAGKRGASAPEPAPLRVTTGSRRGPAGPAERRHGREPPRVGGGDRPLADPGHGRAAPRRPRGRRPGRPAPRRPGPPRGGPHRRPAPGRPRRGPGEPRAEPARRPDASRANLERIRESRRALGADVERARADAEWKRRELERNQELHAKELIAARDVDQARAQSPGRRRAGPDGRDHARPARRAGARRRGPAPGGSGRRQGGRGPGPPARGGRRARPEARSPTRSSRRRSRASWPAATSPPASSSRTTPRSSPWSPPTP